MTKLEFVTPLDAIQVQAAIAIAAPPKHVAAIYREIATWHETFSATIEHRSIAKLIP